MDMETLFRSVTKTERALIVHEAKTSFGVGAEIVRRIGEMVSEIRKNPDFKDFYVESKVLGAKPGPVTAHPALEILRLPQIEDIVEAAKGVLA